MGVSVGVGVGGRVSAHAGMSHIRAAPLQALHCQQLVQTICEIKSSLCVGHSAWGRPRTATGGAASPCEPSLSPWHGA